MPSPYIISVYMMEFRVSSTRYYIKPFTELVLEGSKIRYGQAEPWKVTAAHIGRTKPSRAPQPDEKKRKKNDGRPPTAPEIQQDTQEIDYTKH
jgi:hypothetical protein